MTTHSLSRATDTRALSIATPLLAFTSGAHLIRGLTGLLPSDPIPVGIAGGFVLLGILGLVTVAGIESTLLPPTICYILGIGVTATALVAYADIHALHLIHPLLPDVIIPSGAPGPASSPIAVLTASLRSDPVALTLKLTEFVVLLLFLIAAVRHGVSDSPPHDHD